MTVAPAVPVPEAPQIRRSRYFHRSSRLILVCLLQVLALVGFVIFGGYAASLAFTGERMHGVIALAGLVMFGLCRLIAFGLSRSLSCQLCHGPVLHEKRCRKHSEAQKIPGFSYRASTVLIALTTGGFRCMYCGTPYRLRK